MTDQSVERADKPLSVFLSYSRADRAMAEKLAAALKSAGCEVWWDALIEGGAVFTNRIETALDAADTVVVLWSKTSVSSDWVRDEAGRGRDRKRLVPVSIDGTEPPLGFRQYHAIDLAKWRGGASGSDFQALLHSIGATAGQPEGSVRSAAPARRIGRRTILAGGGAAAVVMVGGSGLLAWQSGLFGGTPAAARTIAVLPFQNLSGDANQRYFSDGLTDDVRAALTRNEALQVLASASSETARAHKDDAVATARRLGVAYLLEGSVRRDGNVVRVAAELTDGKTGFSRWSNSYDRKIDDVFAVQSEIAKLVSGALLARMATDAPAPGGTKSVAAYEALLRGRALFYDAHDEAGDRAALAQFDGALAIDPQFAAAHAARARSLSAIASEYGKASELQSLYRAAIAAAQNAIAIAPDLPEGHLALGNAMFNGLLDVEGARQPYETAYALGHGNAETAVLYAIYCSRAGRAADAAKAIDRAVALDPLNPRTHRASGSVAYAARRYDDAIARLRRAIALNPKIANAWYYIGASLLQQNKFPEARKAFENEPHALFRLSGLAIVDRKLGNRKSAENNMAALIAELGDNALYQQAEVRAQWGETGVALDNLEKARAVGDSGLIYLATDPLVDPIRNEPRFKALLAALHFD